MVAVALTGFAYFVVTRLDRRRVLDPLTLALMGVIGAIAVLQIIPLPASVVALLSPARIELLRAAGAGGMITLSAAPYETAQCIITLGAYALILVMVRDIVNRTRDRDQAWAAVWPLLIIAGLEGALGIFQAYSGAADSVATGTYANRDHFAGLIEMVLPFAVMYPVAVLQRNQKRHESPAGPALMACGILVFAAIILVAIIHSLSRMGFLASLASLFVVGSLALSVRGWRVDVSIKPPIWRRALPIAAVAVIVVLGFIFLPTDPLIARFSDLARTDDISADTRAQIWRDTTGLIKAYPFFGCGLGAYESCFMRYKTVAPMNTVDYAHNDYLQILAEMGVFALAAGLLLAFRIVAATLRRALYARSADERFLMIACTGSIVAMLLHSFVDFNLYVPANGAVFAWICGIAVSGIPP